MARVGEYLNRYVPALLICVSLAFVCWNISALARQTVATYDRPAERRAVYGMLNMESAIGLVEQVLPAERNGADVGFYLPGTTDTVSRNLLAMCLAYHLYPARVRMVDRGDVFEVDYVLGYSGAITKLIGELPGGWESRQSDDDSVLILGKTFSQPSVFKATAATGTARGGILTAARLLGILVPLAVGGTMFALRSPHAACSRPLFWMTAAVGIVWFACVIANAVSTPVFDITGLGVWGLKAKAVFSGGLTGDFLFGHGRSYLHPNYPLGFPAVLALGGWTMGTFDDWLIRLVPAFFGFTIADYSAGATPTVTYVGLWPDGHQSIIDAGLANGPGTDIRINFPNDIALTQGAVSFKRRFHILTPSAFSAVKAAITPPLPVVAWGYFYNCAGYASDRYEAATGEDIEASALPPVTPGDIIQKIDQLEWLWPTTAANPQGMW